MSVIRELLLESGERWLSAGEQRRLFPDVRELHVGGDRPLWLVLSIALRAYGYRFSNGLDISGQMQNMREAIPRRYLQVDVGGKCWV